MSTAAGRDLGDYPTPPDIARTLIRETLGPALARGDVSAVLDPACGEGALLLAAGEMLRTSGADRRGAPLTGVEIHAARAAAARAALARAGLAAARIVRADALARPQPLRDAAFDAVVANPPFLSPTARRGAIPPALRSELRTRHGDAFAALTNVAAIFLLESLQLVRPGGRVGIILPASFLTARDSRGIRAAVLRGGAVEWAWTGGTGVFDAHVAVCGLVVRREGRPRRRIRRAHGDRARRIPGIAFDAGAHADGRPWLLDAGLPADAPHGVVSDLSTPISGFRRHFYAVAGALRDDPEPPGRPVVTAGLIDPGRILWGRSNARIAKHDWRHPRADAQALAASGDVSGWLAATAVPKVLVAVQTRVIECAVDEEGSMIPAVPVIALPVAGPAAWRLAAALTSPHLSRLALARHAGAALSPDAIKMSGSDVGRLPLPRPSPAWDSGAQAMRDAAQATGPDEWRAALVRLAEAMAAAYELGPADDPREWWLDRLPPFRGGCASR